MFFIKSQSSIFLWKLKNFEKRWSILTFLKLKLGLIPEKVLILRRSSQFLLKWQNLLKICTIEPVFSWIFSARTRHEHDTRPVARFVRKHEWTPCPTLKNSWFKIINFLKFLIILGIFSSSKVIFQGDYSASNEFKFFFLILMIQVHSNMAPNWSLMVPTIGSLLPMVPTCSPHFSQTSSFDFVLLVCGLFFRIYPGMFKRLANATLLPAYSRMSDFFNDLAQPTFLKRPEHSATASDKH